MTNKDLENLFTYHSVKPGQEDLYAKIRAAAKEFAKVVLECTPPSEDQSAVIRKIREANMTANASIAISGHTGDHKDDN